jgi:hypothetical protein
MMKTRSQELSEKRQRFQPVLLALPIRTRGLGIAANAAVQSLDCNVAGARSIGRGEKWGDRERCYV